MKAFLALALAVGSLAPSLARAADVGVSVAISQPGVYGRIDIGRFPQPAVILSQPVVIAQPMGVMVPAQPVYMWVPPGHRKHWSRHCAEYNACGVPVYFVRHDWYDSHVRYVDGGGRPGGDRGWDRDRDHDRGDGPGRGRGRGHGHRD